MKGLSFALSSVNPPTIDLGPHRDARLLEFQNTPERNCGFNPCFVQPRNTIENVSTCHTAWATKAIKCHMDEMPTLGDTELVEND